MFKRSFGFKAGLNAILFALVSAFLLQHPSLQGHGFVWSTEVQTHKLPASVDRLHDRTAKRSDPIGLLKRKVRPEYVISYSFSNEDEEKTHMPMAAQGITNCYVVIKLDQNYSNNIICSPLQLFYLAGEEKRWVQAYELHAGSMLFCRKGASKEVLDVTFVPHNIDVYSITVKGNQNFFVGKYQVLAHNMFIPAGTMASFSISIPFGPAIAGAGGALGALGISLGPITIAGGIVLGCLIGMLALKDKQCVYKVDLDRSKLQDWFNPDKGAIEQEKNKKENEDGKGEEGSLSGGKKLPLFPIPPKKPDEEDDDDFVHPSTPVGRRGLRPEMRVQKNIRKATTINGRRYTKHAVERMQERGIYPSSVENTIKNGEVSADVEPGKLRHYDPVNKIKVITAIDTGAVVSVL